MKKIATFVGLPILTLFFVLWSGFAVGQTSASLQPDQTSLVPGQIVLVPVIVTSTFESAYLYITYDKDVLTPASPFFTGVAPDFSITASSPNYSTVTSHIALGSVDFSNHTLAGTSLVTLRFIYNGGSTSLHMRTGEVPDASNSKFFDDFGDQVTPYTYQDATMSGTGYLTVKSVLSGLWKTATTWNLMDNSPVPTGFVPTGNVITNISSATTVTIDASARAKDLTINQGGQLTVNAAIPLAVTGNMLIESNAAGVGSFLNNGTLAVTGTTSAQRWVTANWSVGFPNAATIWHYVASPVSGATLGTFTGSLLNKWNEPLERWDTLTLPLSLPLVPGVGYGLAKHTPDGVVTFTGGVLNNDAFYAPAITYTAGGNPGWNLLGNPYPCAISWDAITSSNVGGAVYTWNGATLNYVSYSGGIGGLTGGIIPAEQAFFVQATGASPTISMPASARQHSVAPIYKNTVENLLTLKVKGNEATEDYAFIHFRTDATTGFDAEFDAYKLFGMESAPQLYSITPSDILSINCLPDVSSQPVVAMGLKVGVNEIYTLTASDLESFTTGSGIFLEDVQTSYVQDLTVNPVYSFTAAPGDDVHRFNIHFSPVGVSEKRASDINIYSAGHTVYVNIPSDINGNIVIYNLLGSEITRKSIQSNSLNKINLDVPLGYYLVKVDGNSATAAGKVFIR